MFRFVRISFQLLTLPVALVVRTTEHDFHAQSTSNLTSSGCLPQNLDALLVDQDPDIVIRWIERLLVVSNES